MKNHVNKVKSQELPRHPSIRVKGGGYRIYFIIKFRSFGYSFTGAYGISSTDFEELSLCR